MTLVCPHCSHPIPDEAVTREAAAISGRKGAGKPRPTKTGASRNPSGRRGKKETTK